jgi:cold shock CspA family protein
MVLFVHASALERSGLTGLARKQQVMVAIGEAREGPEAVRVRLL